MIRGWLWFLLLTAFCVGCWALFVVGLVAWLSS